MNSRNIFLQKLVCFLVFFMTSWFFDKVRGDFKVFDLNKFGSKNGGNKDNKQALLKAWENACKWNGSAQLFIPQGTYLVTPIIFTGPCRGSIVFRNTGTLRAPGGRTDIDKWISFRYVDSLTIDGGGAFDGQGQTAWSDGRGSDPCILMRLDFVSNSWVRNVQFIDSKNVHLLIFGSQTIHINAIKIRAPGDSPNTDGIKIGQSNEIWISNVDIGTGDDCIALLHGSSNINVTNVDCGPGHGISIGSIGRTPTEDPVTNITVIKSSISNATNGLRIKTWGKKNPTSISHIVFEDIVIKETQNPIIIDQNYCPSGNCPSGDSYVQISDVKFRNVTGTSLTKAVVNLQCSREKPCRKIQIEDIDIKYNGHGGIGESMCSNVQGSAHGIQRPPSCLDGRASK